MNTQAIRQNLYAIKTRAETMDALIEQGADSVAAVIPLLHDRDEGIRWAVIRILAEIGDTSALPPLVELLDQSKNVSEVVRALQAISGQDFGDRAADWRAWALRKQGDGESVPGLLSDPDLMAAAIRNLPATMSGEGREYVVNVTLPDRRTHAVRIDFSLRDTEGQPVVQLTTPCGPAVAAQYEAVLKFNMSLLYGAFGLAMLDDTLYFALIHTHLRSTVHPEDIAKSIMCLATHGDSMEKSLSSKDQF